MDRTFQSGSSDRHETSNNTNAYVGGNSSTHISRRAAENRREEICEICFQAVDVNQMHENMYCNHRHCFHCMALYVKINVIEDGRVPRCPRPCCMSRLTKDDCEKFLPSNFIEILIKRLKDAEIPDSDKVYCPYSNCSALMALSTLDRCPQTPSSSSSSSNPFPTTATKCKKCHRSFCIECRVPWHNGISCQEYASQPHSGEADLNLLAEKQQWKRCSNCNHLIERSEGCIHMICRCGFEFCYTCGATWKDRKLLCHCESEYDDDDYTDDDDDDDDDP